MRSSVDEKPITRKSILSNESKSFNEGKSFLSNLGFFHSFKDSLFNLKEKGWLYVFFIIFFAGVMASFTPCVFPMVPLTLTFIGTKKTRSKRESFFLSLVYVLGMALTYSFMGMIASFTGSLFGSFLGHPLVGLFFAFIFILLAFSLFGFFEIQIPNVIRQKAHQYSAQWNQKKMKVIFIFLAGILAGFIASPCVGPLLAALLLYVAKIQDPVFGFFLLFTFSLGLGQLFLFLGVFSQWTLPKLGIWMKRTQYLLGVLLLFLAFDFISPFLKEAFLKEKGFLSFKALNQKNQSVPTGVNLYESKKEVTYGYQWVLFSKKSLKQAKKDQKPVIVDFYASWCLACVRLERKTFKNSEVLKFGQNFLWLKFDVTKMSEEKKKILKEFDVFGLPTLLFFDSSGNQREDLTLRGFEKPSLFIQRMKKLTLPSS